MKKNSRKPKKKKGDQSLDALLKEFKAPPPKNGLTASTLKNFVLYSLYYFNAQFEISKETAEADKKEIDVIFGCFASKFNQNFAD